jgi:hypothetical protein
MATGSLAGNVSFSASSSSSFRCANAGRTRFCVFFWVGITFEPYSLFVSLRYWVSARTTKGARALASKVHPILPFLAEIAQWSDALGRCSSFENRKDLADCPISCQLSDVGGDRRGASPRTPPPWRRALRAKENILERMRLRAHHRGEVAKRTRPDSTRSGAPCSQAGAKAAAGAELTRQ